MQLTPKAYLKDTRQFLQLLNNLDIPDEHDVFLVTAKVASLYIIIQHEDALLCLNCALSEREDLPFIQKKFLGMALDYCLSHNYFWYSGQYYTQTKSVTMGASLLHL